ncbi:MAG: hypothetical protein Ct9H300mP19_02090 [Dehalococcoidia bacterium]|nr:MAG: hypothetical protein Ct9H300mP19_02090 [Dehalococcoidia bacterium]
MLRKLILPERNNYWIISDATAAAFSCRNVVPIEWSKCFGVFDQFFFDIVLHIERAHRFRQAVTIASGDASTDFKRPMMFFTPGRVKSPINSGVKFVVS